MKNSNKLFSTNVFKPSLVSIALLACLPQVVIAIESNDTPPLVGYKPTVDNVVIDDQSPKVGDTLTVNYDYNDVDGDADASTFKWLYNGTAVAGETTKQYTPVFNIMTGVGNTCDDFQVVAEVTAQSQTGDPRVGTAKVSAPVTVQLDLPYTPNSNFTFPEVNARNWGSADSYCRTRSLRLPTRAQLRSLYNTYTIGSTNYQMAQRFRWPMSGGRCGGVTDNYWTSEYSGDGSHFVINMAHGWESGLGDYIMHQVTCVR